MRGSCLAERCGEKFGIEVAEAKEKFCTLVFLAPVRTFIKRFGLFLVRDLSLMLFFIEFCYEEAFL